MTRRPTPYLELAAALDDLPAAVRTARRARGLTLQQAGQRAGVAPSTIAHVETGRACTTTTAGRLLTWLGRGSGQQALDGQP
jgi:ribosome-binding protein aMBF1 (putative translation factor)